MVGFLEDEGWVGMAIDEDILICFNLGFLRCVQ